MKAVLQDKFEIPKHRFDVDPERTGNCYQAALASIFELPIKEIPHFMAMPHSVDWYEQLQLWLQPRGLAAIDVDAKADIMTPQYAGFYLTHGRSPRGGMHTVVSYRGKMVHDPHPSGDGLVEETAHTYFVTIDPSAAMIRA